MLAQLKDLIMPTYFLTNFEDFQENTHKYLYSVILVSVNWNLNNEYGLNIIKHHRQML